MRIEALTFFRFFAAFLVLVHHWGSGTFFEKYDLEFWSTGPPMVTFFYVLSGFVLAVANFKRDLSSFGNFYVARLARIAPAYYVAFLVLLPFVYRAYADFNVNVAVGLHLTFLQAWIPPYPATLNMAAWSVSVEMFFYLVFPLFFPLLRQSRFSSGLLFTIGAVIFLLTQLVLLSIVNSPSFEGDRSFVGIVIRFNPLAHFCSFFLGIVGAIWFLRTQSRQQEKGNGLVSLIVLSAVIYLLLNNEVKIREMLPLELPAHNSLHAPLFLAFIIVIARGNNFIVNTLGRGVFKSLGDASYGFYIYQYPVICILYYVVGITDYMSTDAAFGVLAVTLLAISLLSFHYFEVPVQRRVRQAISRGTPS